LEKDIISRSKDIFALRYKFISFSKDER